jgi:SAM-dependent methyltransferase
MKFWDQDLHFQASAGVLGEKGRMENTRAQPEAVRIANERLFPSITDPHYLVLRRRTQIIRKWIDRLPVKDQIVLDVGGRYQPYRPLIESRTRRYVALDVLVTPLVDVIGRGEQLPFSSDTFDVVIATAVFEYFPEPRKVAEQIHDVLKPGGALILSVGAVCPRFADEEHWRYMPAGLRSTLSMFSHVEIVPEVFSLGGFCRIVNASLNIFAKYGIVRRTFSTSVFPIINLIGLGLEGMALTSNDQIAGNYSVLARK